MVSTATNCRPTTYRTMLTSSALHDEAVAAPSGLLMTARLVRERLRALDPGVNHL